MTTPRPMSAARRIQLSALATLAFLPAGCDRRQEAESAPPPPVAPITVPGTDDPAWAARPLPGTVRIPTHRDPGRARRPLDHFILASLESNQLAPAPPADPLTWFRRASIHLTGLPPTPDAIRQFQSGLGNPQVPDPEPLLESTADQLLASPAFGDQLATMWLDAVGYTDMVATTGDRLNGQWPYRDWVVDAFNANLPYDEFLTAQLAGDLLESPSPGQLLATAFLRTHPLDHGAGITPDEAIRRNTFARTDSLGRAVLGLPLTCSRCHDTPEAPVSRAEYLSLTAFFDSLAESGRPVPPGVVHGPTLALPNDEELTAIREAAAAEAATGKLLRQARLDSQEAFLAWHADPLKIPVIPDLTAAFSFDERMSRSPNRSLTGTGFADRGSLPLAPGISGQAVRGDGEHPVTLNGSFTPARWNAWTFSFWIRPPDEPTGPAILLSHGDGIELRIDHGRLLATLQRDFPGNAIAILTPEPVAPSGAWTHLAWSYDGSNTAAGLRLHVNGRPTGTMTVADQLWGAPLPPPGGPSTILLGAGNGAPGFSGSLDELQAFSRALTPPEIAHLHDGRSLPAAKRGDATGELREYYFSSIDSTSRSLRRRLALDRKATLEAELAAHEVAVARERLIPVPAPSRSLPSILPALPDPLPGPARSRPDRLTLARSLTAPDHPFTARVFVNRLWARFFGEGLAATTGDLGPTGAAPRYPELLDWLSRDFITHDWDIKHLCRQIVLSAAYRRSSLPTMNQLLRDPHNRLLARYPAHPLPPLAAGEFLLAITERLDTGRGGPPRPGTPRAPYGVWSTPLRPPATGFPACPLGAKPAPGLVETLRPPDEAGLLTTSRLLAQQTLEEVNDDTARLRILFATLAGRFPNTAEQAGLDELLADLRTRAGDVDAPRLIRPGAATGDSPPPIELALWTELTRAILRSRTPLWVR